MIKALKTHMQGIKIAFASRIAYRGDFLLSFSIILLSDLVLPAVTWLIYRSGASFPGWSLYEVLLIQSVFMISRGVAFTLFFGIVWYTLDMVREGSFDLLLLKPHSTLHMTMVLGFSCDDLGMVLGGICLFIISLSNISGITWLNVLQFVLLLAVSLCVLAAFAILMSATVFKWVGNSRVYEIFDSISFFGQYPTSIFSRPFAHIITWIIPVSMTGFIPASVLIGRASAATGLSVIASIVFLILSILFWNFTKKKYTSAGG